MKSSNVFNIRIFIYALLFLLPIFVNLNISNGLNFSANPFNSFGAPSIPLSLIFFLALFLLNIHKISLTKVDALFLVIVALFMLLNIFVVFNIRAFLLGLGMLILVVNTSLIKEKLKSYGFDDILHNFFMAISVVVLSKFISDIVLFNTISSEYFMSRKFAIYNYYDYFSFIYLLCISLSINYINHKKNITLSVANIFICLIVLSVSHSRLFLVAGVCVIPAMLFLKYVPIKFSILFFVSSGIVVLATIILGISGYSPTSDHSLIVRFEHWHSFFSSLQPLDLIFTFNNEYRKFMNWGTFHNEYLEIFSYYGLLVFYYMAIIFLKFTDINIKISRAMQVVCLLLILGTFVQLNFTNPYIVLLISFVLGMASQKRTFNIQKH